MYFKLLDVMYFCFYSPTENCASNHFKILYKYIFCNNSLKIITVILEKLHFQAQKAFLLAIKIVIKVIIAQ